MEHEPIHFLFGFQTNWDALDWAQANASGDFSTLIGIKRRYPFWLGPDISYFVRDGTARLDISWIVLGLGVSGWLVYFLLRWQMKPVEVFLPTLIALVALALWPVTWLIRRLLHWANAPEPDEPDWHPSRHYRGECSGIVKCACGFEGEIGSAAFYEHISTCQEMEWQGPWRRE